jgi:DNA-binding NtrC family response regulator
MQHPVLNVLFLGETSSWNRLSQSLHDSPDVPLRVHRFDSLGDLFKTLSNGHFQAIVVDIHAWKFRGLHYLEKVRSRYPVFPLLALHNSAVADLASKAAACGASRCFPLDQLSASVLYDALTSMLDDIRTQFRNDEDLRLDLLPPQSEGGTLSFSKTQIITHALSNLLCVISANADLLSDSLNGSAAIAARPITEIKKATRSAAFLLRHLN